MNILFLNYLFLITTANSIRISKNVLDVIDEEDIKTFVRLREIKLDPIIYKNPKQSKDIKVKDLYNFNL